MFTVNKNPTPAELRKFGWAMLIGFSVIGLALWYLSARSRLTSWYAWVGDGYQVATAIMIPLGILLVTISVNAPGLARPIYMGWMTVTVPIGIVMSTILLTLLYFILLPVFALIVRSGDPLRRRLGANSYWEDYKPYEHSLERMGRLF